MASVSRRGRKALLGKKLGMTHIFEEDGSQVPVTVLQAGPCTVLQVKSSETDGYAAFQLGFDERRKKAKRPQQAYLDRYGLSSQRFVHEVPHIEAGDVLPPASGGSDAPIADAAEGEGGEADGAPAGGEVRTGSRIGVAVFREVKKVDIRGITKGRGFSGTIKRHGFRRGDASHGSKNVREPGSTGQHTDPSRVFKGKKMPGQHGNARRKIRNLRVVRIDEGKNLLLVRGAVPGPRGGYVYIEESLS